MALIPSPPRISWLFAIVLWGAIACPAVAEDALDRLSPQRLAAVRATIVKLRSERKTLRREEPWKEFRANLHVHSSLSHDSRGTIEEIVRAAKAAGTQIVMFTEHPANHYDVFDDGHRAMHDGVLLVPGAETKGLLAFPMSSPRAFQDAQAQEYSDAIRGRGGLTFLSHLEERMDWELRGLTGVEIYNTHADFKDEKRLAAALRNPLWLVGAAAVFRTYPQEALSALHDYPADYLKRWDELCRLAPHTGIAANDAHQNVGLVVKLTDDKRARVEDALGQKLLELDAAGLAELELAPADAKPGAVLMELRLDPYENSLRHVGTHLLMKELSQPAVWDALNSGRAFVAFDWLADATGFEFAAVATDGRHEMGSRLKHVADLCLIGRAPLPARWKLVRDGRLLTESTGNTFEHAVSEPGIYRVELWLNVAGHERIWILSNPLYIQP